MNRSIIEYLSFAHNTNLITIAIGVIAILCVFFVRPIKKKSAKTLVPTIILCLIFIWRLGFLPVGWGISGDREIYAHRLFGTHHLDNSYILTHEQDPLFTILSKIIYNATDLQTYFVGIAAIYVSLYFFACRRMVDKNQVWLFVTVILSMGFIAYGYNTIRAGLAFSIFLFAITYRKNLIMMLGLLLLASGIHFSVAIPTLMFLVSKYFPLSKVYFALWVLSIPVSFFAGDFFNNLFSQFSEDQRTEYLIKKNTHYNIGFRIDFIVYSLLPVIVGYYYIFVRKFKSVWYKNIYNTYLLTNIFWILVITSNYSDRFAYLSWFLIPFILVYPVLINYRIVRKPNYWLAGLLLEEVLFKLVY